MENRIQPKELRIGNLIYVHGKVHMVTSINCSHTDSPPHLFLTVEGDKRRRSCFLNEKVCGIPLTEDKLIEFGFEKSDALRKESQRVCVIDNFHVVIDFQEYWGWCYSINPIQVVPIKYIHTLQNLIFALTQTELQTAQSGENMKG